VDPDHLLLMVERALAQRRMATENILLKDELAARRGAPQIVGEDARLKQVSVALQRAAATDTTVLLEGESGTGKELFARALHALSPRNDGPFVAINCAAIPENLLETELFGHEKGAFTGASQRKSGKFELAHRGTLVLDEIGDLHPSLAAPVDEDGGPWAKIDLSGTLAEASKRTLLEVERRKLQQALKEGGSPGAAAEILQVSYKAVLAKLKEHGLDQI